MNENERMDAALEALARWARLARDRWATATGAEPADVIADAGAWDEALVEARVGDWSGARAVLRDAAMAAWPHIGDQIHSDAIDLLSALAGARVELSDGSRRLRTIRLADLAALWAEDVDADADADEGCEDAAGRIEARAWERDGQGTWAATLPAPIWRAARRAALAERIREIRYG